MLELEPILVATNLIGQNNVSNPIYTSPNTRVVFAYIGMLARISLLKALPVL